MSKELTAYEVALAKLDDDLEFNCSVGDGVDWTCDIDPGELLGEDVLQTIRKALQRAIQRDEGKK